MTLPEPSGRHDRAPAEPGFGVYIHWPFCRSLCPYCDFNSHVRESVDQGRWRRALIAELEHYAESAPGREVTSVFFGGGTPSLMAPETVGALIERVGALWRLAPEAEITLEANPTSVEAGKFAGFQAAGVTRVSLGVQSFDDAALAVLGRRHSAAEAVGALDLARRHFQHVSFDLIYARPDQTAAAWRRELARALAEAPSHLSAYQLTIEPGTVFHGAARRGELVVPEEAPAAELYEATQEVLEHAGLPAYEISNHARPGAACRHNLTTWRCGDYLGVGPGAHGRLTLGAEKLATRQHRAPEAWLERVEAAGHGTRERRRIDPGERLSEMLLLGLRLTEGVSRAAFRREAGAEPEQALGERRLKVLAEAGYLELDRAGLRATAAGRQRLNALLGYLVSETPA
jgi:oxygen-independent coproporphyrinogen-3 oxidase